MRSPIGWKNKVRAVSKSVTVKKRIFGGLHQNIKMVSGFRICPIIAINLQPSIETGQDCNGTGGFILAQESNSHNKKNRNPKSHDWSYVE